MKRGRNVLLGFVVSSGLIVSCTSTEEISTSKKSAEINLEEGSNSEEKKLIPVEPTAEQINLIENFEAITGVNTKNNKLKSYSELYVKDEKCKEGNAFYVSNATINRTISLKIKVEKEGALAAYLNKTLAPDEKKFCGCTIENGAKVIYQVAEQ